MAELWLVCEGEAASADVAVLRPVFANVLAAEIVVEPACGSSPNVVARFLRNHRGGKAAYLTDRDYRPRADADAAFVDGTDGFLWRRHSIENYLLQPMVAVRAFRQLREKFERQRPGHVPHWLAAVPNAPEQVADAMRECARKRAAEEACRLATYRLWAALPNSIGQIQKRDPPTPTTLGPIGPDDWRAAFHQEVERVRNAATQTASAPQFEAAAVSAWFDAAYGEVTANAYVDSLEFLIDFHGRDLLKEFGRWLNDNGMPLSYRRLRDELSTAAVVEYKANRTIYGSDDFRDLANGVRSLAGLSPLA